MSLKCKTCGLEFESKDRLERHKKVHARKSKVTYAGSRDLSQLGI